MIVEQEFEFNAESLSLPSPLARAWADMVGGIAMVAVWGILGWQDIRQRYRRSVLGPFWLTISTAIMVGALGFVYSGLFKQPLGEYLPYIGVGMIVWALISSIANESCSVFPMAEGMIKQIRLPLTVHVCRMVWRNIVIFGHNAIILVVIYAFYGKGLHVDLLTIPFAVLLLALNGVWVGVLLGIFCTRFRDIAQIVANMIQLLFFVTPIMWSPAVLGERAWIATYNPVYHYIELIRSPILGHPFPAVSWAVTFCITALGLLIALAALTRYRHRVAYWL
ncbi:MAG: ABC transporter permease [Bdellovibrionales bacterium]|nr:ABC transporter permease [Ramlibacter sp.]